MSLGVWEEEETGAGLGVRVRYSTVARSRDHTTALQGLDCTHVGVMLQLRLAYSGLLVYGRVFGLGLEESMCLSAQCGVGRGRNRTRSGCTCTGFHCGSKLGPHITALQGLDCCPIALVIRPTFTWHITLFGYLSQRIRSRTSLALSGVCG